MSKHNYFLFFSYCKLPELARGTSIPFRDCSTHLLGSWHKRGRELPSWKAVKWLSFPVLVFRPTFGRLPFSHWNEPSLQTTCPSTGLLTSDLLSVDVRRSETRAGRMWLRLRMTQDSRSQACQPISPFPSSNRLCSNSKYCRSGEQPLLLPGELS